MRKLVRILLLLTVIVGLFFYTKKHWVSTYYEYYGQQNYVTATKNEKFVIAIEPSSAEYLELSVFVRNLLTAAFNDYNVVFDRYATKPNLIVRSESITQKEARSLRADLAIPYITISGEPTSIRKTKYRKHGYPFAELISTTPQNERELYFPFIGWSEVKIVEPRNNNFATAKKSVLYVSSNCIKEREEFFAILSLRKTLTVEALGTCSNPTGQKASGGYKDLDRLYAQYQFVFAMENCQKPGYITEKIVNVFNSGAIPIYWGDSQTVNKLFNNKAFVNIADFKTMYEAADYIEALSLDQTRLQDMHQQPIFNQDKSPLLALDSENNPYVLEQAKKLRNLYEEYLVKHQKNKKLIWLLTVIFIGISGFKGWKIYNQSTAIDPCLSIKTNAIGNRLSDYFYFTNTANASDRKLKREKACNAKTLNQELHAFYSKLNWMSQKTVIDYKSNPEAEWNELNNDGSIKPNYLAYWQAIRPQARALYEQNIPQTNNPHPIVHFRCSDIPFLRHYHYHLNKATVVDWIANKIKEHGFSKVIFLNCHKHNKIDVQNSCSKYVDFYTQIFQTNGLEVETQCNGIFQDFALMVHAPLLASLNASSFAFMAGVSKDPQDYIACNMGIEVNGRYFRQKNADWLIAPSDPLLHQDIEDYHNAAEVVEKLSKP